MAGSYVGLNSTPGLRPNNTVSLGNYPQAMYILRGTVLGGYQGLQYYDVATDYGRVLCGAIGNGAGLLGAQEAVTYLPGEQVLVSYAPSSPAQNSFIIGRADTARAGDYTRPCPLLVYPQVAGFEAGVRFSGKAYSQFPRLRNFNSGISDVVDGEWVRHNMFGGAVGVEAFRTFLQAGPMAGVYAYTEDQHIKIVAARYNLFTMHTSYETEQLANSGGEVRKTYHYLTDQQMKWQAQKIELTGAAYNGASTFLTYPDGVNGSNSHTPEPEEDEDGVQVDEDADPLFGQSRVALVHEHKGADGHYLLSAASSLTLQKTTSIPVPIDIVEAEGYVTPVVDEDEEETEEEETEEGEEEETTCCVSNDMSADPATGIGTCATEEGDCTDSVTGPVFDSYRSGNPLSFAMNARGMADRLIANILSSTTNLCRWGIGASPTDVLGEKTPDELLFNQDPSMWKNMPQTFRLALAPGGEAKRFYWGRALISITEDGSVVLQDAQGSSLMLSGGNIYLSANHDVISVAGRNDVRVSGRDMALRAGRHVDVNANEGRATIMAAEQTSLVGGTSGHGGVLIESKGEHAASDTTGSNGNNPPTSGGVILKANHMVGVTAPNITLKARQNGWSGLEAEGGHIYMDVGNSVEIRSGEDDSSARYSFGATMQLNLPEDVRIQFGGKTSVLFCNVYLCKSLFYYKQFMHDTEDEGKVLTGLKAEQTAIEKMQDAELDSDMSPLNMSGFKARWLTSANYNIERAEHFQLPEPEWQTRARVALPSESSVLQSLMVDNTVEGTSPLPGNEAWTDYAMAAVTSLNDDETWYDNPDISVDIISQPADGGLFKGI